MTRWLDPSTVYWDDWLLLVVQALTLVALVVYVWKTARIAHGTLVLAEESKQARETALAPRVVIYFDPSEVYFAHFVIENVGSGTAADVRFSFDPPLQTAERFGGTEFFATPKVLPPGGRLVHLFDSWSAYLQSSLPKRYQVTVSFRGVETGQTYTYVHELDVEAIRHRHGLRRHGLHDLVERIEKLERSLHNDIAMLTRAVDTSVAHSQLAGRPRELREAMAAFQSIHSVVKAAWSTEGEAYVDWDGGLAAMRAAGMELYASAKAADAGEDAESAILRLMVSLHHHTYSGDQNWMPRLDTAVAELEAVMPPRPEHPRSDA